MKTITTKKIGFWALYFSLCLLAWPINAKQNRLLECLGSKELAIHRIKSNGPIYYLNQEFINEITGISDVDIKESYYKKVCRNKHFSPSVALLKELMINGEDLFDYSNVDLTVTSGMFTKTSAKALLNRIPHIWFSYLAQLLSYAPSAKCFKKEIPEVQYFHDRFQYLEVEYGLEQLLDDKSKILSIFEKLKTLDRTLKKCQRYVEDKTKSKPVSKAKKAVK